MRGKHTSRFLVQDASLVLSLGLSRAWMVGIAVMYQAAVHSGVTIPARFGKKTGHRDFGRLASLISEMKTQANISCILLHGAYVGYVPLLSTHKQRFDQSTQCWRGNHEIIQHVRNARTHRVMVYEHNHSIVHAHRTELLPFRASTTTVHYATVVRVLLRALLCCCVSLPIGSANHALWFKKKRKFVQTCSAAIYLFPMNFDKDKQRIG